MTEARLSLATLKGGAALELVDEAIQQLLENIVDPNTDAETKRKVTLTITLSPDAEREMMGLGIDVKASFAPRSTVASIAWISHTHDGVIALEHNPHQKRLFDEEQGEGASVVDIKGGAK